MVAQTGPDSGVGPVPGVRASWGFSTRAVGLRPIEGVDEAPRFPIARADNLHFDRKARIPPVAPYGSYAGGVAVGAAGVAFEPAAGTSRMPVSVPGELGSSFPSSSTTTPVDASVVPLASTSTSKRNRIGG